MVLTAVVTISVREDELGLEMAIVKFMGSVLTDCMITSAMG